MIISSKLPENRFAFEPHWRALPGMAYGLRQPVILGKVHVRLRHGFTLRALDERMVRYVSEPAPEPLAADARIALVQRALHWITAVQRQMKIPIFRTGMIGSSRSGEQGLITIHLAVPSFAPQATRAALEWVGAAVGSFIVSGQLSRLGQDEERRAFETLKTTLQPFGVQGLNMFHFLQAADQIEAPFRWVAKDIYSFGIGRCSHWLDSSFTERTSVLGVSIAQDKAATARILRQAGLPAPTHALATSPEAALQVAARLGYPVVVKPADKDQGVGVAANLADDTAVLAAFQEAAKHSKRILIEKHVDGQDYRLTILSGRLIKTVLRVPGGVVGDGVHTVAALVERERQKTDHDRRARASGKGLLALDPEALGLLGEQGLTPAAVPPAGAYLCLRRRANISAGGTPIWVNEAHVHPDNRQLAVRAAAALNLDLAGIDLLIADISKSWLEVGGIICEVNAKPQIGWSTSPGIYVDILRMLHDNGFRIPIILVIGEPGSLEWQLLEHWRATGGTVGYASREGVWQGTERLTGPQSDTWTAGRIVMADHAIDGAVIVMNIADIVRFGLPFDRCDLVVLAPPDSNLRDDPKLLGLMWPMILPHVATAIVAPASARGLLPDQARLRNRGVRVVECLPDEPAMVSAIFDQLASAPDSVAPGLQPSHPYSPFLKRRL